MLFEQVTFSQKAALLCKITSRSLNVTVTTARQIVSPSWLCFSPWSILYHPSALKKCCFAKIAKRKNIWLHTLSIHRVGATKKSGGLKIFFLRLRRSPTFCIHYGPHPFSEIPVYLPGAKIITLKHQPLCRRDEDTNDFFALLQKSLKIDFLC